MLKVLNAGTATDSFVLTASGAASGWTLKAFDTVTGASVITALTGSGWTVGPLAPGAGYSCNLYATAGTAVLPGVPMTLTCTAVSASDGSKKDVVLAVTTALGALPDLLVKAAADSSYLGQGIIDLDGSNQTRSQTVATGVTASYVVKVLNAGTSTDNFVLTMSGGATGWTLTAIDNASGSSVITALTGAGWTVGPLAPGAGYSCTINATAGGTAAPGVPMTLTCTAVSVTDGTKKDVVKAVTTALGAQPDLLIKAIADTAYLGQGIVNLDGTNQTRNQTVAGGATAGYMVKVLNAGSSADSFVLTAVGSASGWTLKAFDTVTGASILTALTGSGWTVGPLAPGAGYSCNFYVTPAVTVTSGTALPVTFTAVSTTDGTRKDVVQAVTTKQ